MRVCKHGCDVQMFYFSRTNQAIFKTMNEEPGNGTAERGTGNL